MNIESLDQFKEICPKGAYDAFMEGAREGDPDFMLDVMAEINDGYFNPNEKESIWIEFNDAMRAIWEKEGLYFNLENNLTDEVMEIVNNNSK